MAIPTETVYGLAANALNETAVLKIFEAKNRPFFDPLIVHLPDVESINEFATDIPDLALRLAEQFMPGPFTLLLKKKAIIPDLVTSGLDKVGVRVPAHPLSRQLLQYLDFPLAAPSANPFGYISPTTSQHVMDQLAGKIPMILEGGACMVGLESTIVEVDDNCVIIHRLGGTSIEAIQTIAPQIKLQLNQSSNPHAPGQLASHYAPKKTIFIGDIAELAKRHSHSKKGIITFSSLLDIENSEAFVLSPTSDMNEAARNIFKALRHFDKSNCEVILAELLPEQGLGRAINDRLKRAAASV